MRPQVRIHFVFLGGGGIRLKRDAIVCDWDMLFVGIVVVRKKTRTDEVDDYDGIPRCAIRGAPPSQADDAGQGLGLQRHPVANHQWQTSIACTCRGVGRHEGPLRGKDW